MDRQDEPREQIAKPTGLTALARRAEGNLLSPNYVPGSSR